MDAIFQSFNLSVHGLALQLETNLFLVQARTSIGRQQQGAMLLGAHRRRLEDQALPQATEAVVVVAMWGDFIII